MKKILKESPKEGILHLDIGALASNLGFTKSAFEMKLRDVGFRQISLEAKRLASVRAFDQKTPLNVKIEDIDLLLAASEILDSPMKFTKEEL